MFLLITNSIKDGSISFTVNVSQCAQYHDTGTPTLMEQLIFLVTPQFFPAVTCNATVKKPSRQYRNFSLTLLRTVMC